MSKYKGHTPGLWYVTPIYIPYDFEDAYDDKPICWRITNGEEWREEGEYAIDIQVDSNEADARLIADAPKLLAERDRLREVLAEIIAVTSEEDVTESRIDAAFNIAREALHDDNGTTMKKYSDDLEDKYNQLKRAVQLLICTKDIQTHYPIEVSLINAIVRKDNE